jgi:AmiR/NasT family two-component response regulator
VLIDIENPSRNVPEELTLATGPLERPVALFVGRSGDGMTRAAIEAGVSAYVVDGMRPERIKPVMDAAIARFRPFRRMRTELDAAKQALEERKVIDRAKGMLMRSGRGRRGGLCAAAQGGDGPGPQGGRRGGGAGDGRPPAAREPPVSRL